MPNLIPRQVPAGDDDPNLIYIAVGRAIHAWEQMESALAELYLKFKSLPANPDNLAEYGDANRKFEARKRAVQEAANLYFVASPDQAREGRFREIIATLDDLAIERHRIAHGHISMFGSFEPPDIRVSGQVEVAMKFYWAAPFYSQTNLRTAIVGKNAEGIDAMHDRFSTLNDEIRAFTEPL